MYGYTSLVSDLPATKPEECSVWIEDVEIIDESLRIKSVGKFIVRRAALNGPSVIELSVSDICNTRMVRAPHSIPYIGNHYRTLRVA